MPDFKEIAKHGWHPDKNETTFRGQVGAVFGRKSNTQSNADREVTPISHLRDPASFAPPPKRTGAGVLPPPGVGARPGSSSPAQQHDYGDQQHQQQGADEPPPPPRPYRVDTSGLSTAHLPPPPGRRDGADGRDPTASPPPPPYSATAKPPPPSLPPRLPPRNSNASPGPSAAGASPGLPAPAAPGRQTGFLNQGAVDRLGSSGVSVPGLGIGSGSRQVLPPPPPSRSGASSPSPAPATGTSGTMNELQSRFSKFGGFGKSSTPSPPPAQAAAPSQGTTWAQKQAALKTMSDFKKDPSSVSFADANSAASTANNFRERHGEQVAAGAQKANSLNQKYGVADKVGGYLGNASGGAGSSSGAEVVRTPSPAQSPLGTISNAAGLLGKKKPPPPPPPKKKPALGGNPVDAGDDDAPPPVPMATRPF